MAELWLLMAAARIPAITSPAMPAGRECTMNAGEHLVARHAIGRQAHRPDCDAHEQEERELQHHDDAGPDERHLRIAQRAGREQALHDELVGAVRGGAEAARRRRCRRAAYREW